MSRSSYLSGIYAMRALLLLLLLLLLPGCTEHEPAEIPRNSSGSPIIPPLDTTDPVQFYEQEQIPDNQNFIPEHSGEVAAAEYQDLQTILPQGIDGYGRGAPPGGSVQDIDGVKLTSTTQQWLSNDGSHRLKVGVTDGRDAQGYAVAASIMIPVDPGDSSAVVKSLDSGKGATYYSKQEMVSQATIGVGDRYIVDVRATGTERDLTTRVEQIARNIAQDLR